MAIKDIRSNLITQFLGNENPTGSATTPFTGVVDNAAYELGVMFYVQVGTAQATTSSTMVVQQSDDPTFASFTTIVPGDENYIGIGLVDPSVLSLVPTATTSLTTENRIVTCGVFSNLRYLRLAILDVGGTDGYNMNAFAVSAAENKPTEPPKP